MNICFDGVKGQAADYGLEQIKYLLKDVASYSCELGGVP